MDNKIIGGADGSTSIFLAGMSWYTIALIAIICIAIIIFFIRKKKSNN